MAQAPGRLPDEADDEEEAWRCSIGDVSCSMSEEDEEKDAGAGLCIRCE